MRGYYYQQNDVPPAPWQVPPDPKRPPRRDRGVLVPFLCVLAVLLGLVILLCVALYRLGDIDSEANFHREEWREPDSWESQQTTEVTAKTTVERAPTADGTTLTIVPAGAEAPHSFQQIYQENISSIVSIWGTASDGMAFGTGVVMTENGYIITNAHVIEGCSEVEVCLQNEETYPALLVGYDVQTDLAVLKVGASGLTPAQFGDSSALQVGDTVLATI